MILRESKEEQTLEYASNIKSAGNTLLSIINDILDFSKIEDGKMSLVMVEFDVTEWVNGLVNSIQERARAKGLELKIDVDESVPSKLYGDDVRLTQVVVNLLTNAVKYTEKGSVTLRIRNTEIKDDNVCLRFDVIDTGIGIKSQDMDKLFMTFERIEEKRNRNIEGTGLGLSIVNKLLSMMDSKLDVSSRYGVGSSFSFSVSLKIVDKEPIGNYEERRKQLIMRSQNVEERLYAPKARVLIVDDNDMNLKVAKSFMKLFGIKPDTCSSGKETLDILKSRQYDIIFLDHMMPVLDGIETLRLAKDKNLVHDAVVIALTANAVVGAKEQYLKSGFNGYLSKPIVVKDIEKTLKKFLPEDIIEEAAPGTESSSSTTSITLDKVREIGLNTDAGIEYACGEEDLYLDLLSDYAKGCEDKCKELDSYLDKEDMKNYSILIHSLKSSSRIIGADAISAQAKDLEDASKKNDIDFVQLNHDNFKERYKSLAAKLLG
jgi:CheY-like chemotaxis protein/HPt (histidine-containing phosphotransfer) domain-containing protein